MHNEIMSVNNSKDNIYKILATHDISKLAYKITANNNTFAKIGYLKDFSNDCKTA